MSNKYAKNTTKNHMTALNFYLFISNFLYYSLIEAQYIYKDFKNNLTIVLIMLKNIIYNSYKAEKQKDD